MGDQDWEDYKPAVKTAGKPVVQKPSSSGDWQDYTPPGKGVPEGTISARPDRPVANWFEDLKGDVQHGTGLTLPGRALRYFGAKGTSSGVPEEVGNLVGGVAVGPAEIGEGSSNLMGSGRTGKERVQGANEIFHGVGHSLAIPAAATAPAALPTFVGAGATQAGVSKLGEKAGLDPDTSELIGNLSMLGVPAAKEAAGPVGRFMENNAPTIGKVVGTGSALGSGIAEAVHTKNPMWLLSSLLSEKGSKAAEFGSRNTGKGLQLIGTEPLLPHEITGSGRPGTAMGEGQSGPGSPFSTDLIDLTKTKARNLVDIPDRAVPTKLSPDTPSARGGYGVTQEGVNAFNQGNKGPLVNTEGLGKTSSAGEDEFEAARRRPVPQEVIAPEVGNNQLPVEERASTKIAQEENEKMGERIAGRNEAKENLSNPAAESPFEDHEYDPEQVQGIYDYMFTEHEPGLSKIPNKPPTPEEALQLTPEDLAKEFHLNQQEAQELHDLIQKHPDGDLSGDNMPRKVPKDLEEKEIQQNNRAELDRGLTPKEDNLVDIPQQPKKAGKARAAKAAAGPSKPDNLIEIPVEKPLVGPGKDESKFTSDHAELIDDMSRHSGKPADEIAKELWQEFKAPESNDNLVEMPKRTTGSTADVEDLLDDGKISEAIQAMVETANAGKEEDPFYRIDKDGKVSDSALDFLEKNGIDPDKFETMTTAEMYKLALKQGWKPSETLTETSRRYTKGD